MAYAAIVIFVVLSVMPGVTKAASALPWAWSGDRQAHAGHLTAVSEGVSQPAARKVSIQEAPARLKPADNATPVVHGSVGDDAIYAGDISIPDGTVFKPGQRFTKTWRIKNIGTNTWGTGYTWHFEAGHQLSSILSVGVPPTAPGGIATVAVSMTAPAAKGDYISFWQMVNPQGQLFGHQAWVRIVVRGAASPSATTATPSGTVSPQAAASATPTGPPPASPTDTPAAAGVAPTMTIPGGSGALVGSPWVGALTFRTYFAAGTTNHGLQESLNVYYPGAARAHVRLTLYRPDGASRSLQFTLEQGTRRLIGLNRIAPNTDLAIAVEADRAVLTNRIAYGQSSIIGDPGAARTARFWLFPAAPSGDSGMPELVLFNPHEVPARVTLRLGLPQGGCCARTVVVRVPPLRQFVYPLGAGAAARSPLSLSATDVVAAERLLVAPGWAGVTAIPGAVAPAVHWYLADARSGGSPTTVTLFNPGARPVQASMHLALAKGQGPWQQRTVPAFGQVNLSLSGLTTSVALGIEVDADGPVVAGAMQQAGTASPSAYLGAIEAARSWLVLGGYAGRGTSQTISVINPGNSPCTITFQAEGDIAQRIWHVSVPAHGRYARILDGLVAGNQALSVRASAPVAVGRTVSSKSGSATSTGVAVVVP